MKKNLDERKAKVLTVGAVLLLLIIVIGAAYAYFAAQVGNGTSADVNVITGTTDLLTFSINDLDASTGNDKVTDNDSSEEIIINANETNFGKNEDGSIDNSIADGVKAAATLMANNTTKKANDSYNVFLVIDLNQLKHTTPENKPELLLTVTNPNQETMRQIVSNLEYHQKDISNEKDVDGFDITGKREVIEIAKDYQIKVDGSTDESNLTTTQEWKIKVTLVNLTTNQNENTGKQVTGKVIITKEDNIKLSNINTLSINRTINNITAEVKADNEEIAEYYFKIDGEMPEAAALSLENDEEWAKEEQATHNFGTLKKIPNI